MKILHGALTLHPTPGFIDEVEFAKFYIDNLEPYVAPRQCGDVLAEAKRAADNDEEVHKAS